MLNVGLISYPSDLFSKSSELVKMAQIHFYELSNNQVEKKGPFTVLKKDITSHLKSNIFFLLKWL